MDASHPARPDGLPKIQRIAAIVGQPAPARRAVLRAQSLEHGRPGLRRSRRRHAGGGHVGGQHVAVDRLALLYRSVYGDVPSGIEV